MEAQSMVKYNPQAASVVSQKVPCTGLCRPNRLAEEGQKKGQEAGWQQQATFTD
jgi:hypothetical protein